MADQSDGNTDFRNAPMPGETEFGHPSVLHRPFVFIRDPLTSS